MLPVLRIPFMSYSNAPKPISLAFLHTLLSYHNASKHISFREISVERGLSVLSEFSLAGGLSVLSAKVYGRCSLVDTAFPPRLLILHLLSLPSSSRVNRRCSSMSRTLCCPQTGNPPAPLLACSTMFVRKSTEDRSNGVRSTPVT